MTDYLAIARDLQPLIREAADEADRTARLPARVATGMAEAGLYRLTIASAFGGIEADPLTTFEVIEAISQADGAAGWNLMISLETAGIASGAATNEAGEAVYASNPNMIMSGALIALARGRRVPGGWRVSGRWPFASGCHNASWFWGGFTQYEADGTPILNAAGAPRAVQALIPMAQATIIETWDVAGLRGSGSHNVEFTDIFVPDAFTTDVYGAPMRQTTALFRYPLISRLCFTKVAVATGIARTALDAFIDLANGKTPYASRTLLRERAQAQLAIAEAEALLGGARAFVLSGIRGVWDEVCAGRTPSPDVRMRQRLAASTAVQWAAQAVDLVHAAAGSTVNYTKSPLERCFRDVHVVPQHVTVAPTFFETAGRALLGMPVLPGSF
ncbi:MAG: acyl-CoA dehydrogenase family protein [Dehalococcoidia bacterium]